MSADGHGRRGPQIALIFTDFLFHNLYLSVLSMLIRAISGSLDKDYQRNLSPFMAQSVDLSYFCFWIPAKSAFNQCCPR
jgi:hypothetical protein